MIKDKVSLSLIKKGFLFPEKKKRFFSQKKKKKRFLYYKRKIVWYIYPSVMFFYTYTHKKP